MKTLHERPKMPRYWWKSYENVLIIYTGGTIGMTRTENGYAPAERTVPPRDGSHSLDL